MTDKQILEQAISRAIDGGWRGDMLNIKVEQQDNGIVRVYWDETEWSVLDIVYNKAFAKALWGEEATYDMTHVVKPDNTYRMNVRPAWEYHLQQMVIAEDPIKYLGENI